VKTERNIRLAVAEIPLVPSQLSTNDFQLLGY